MRGAARGRALRRGPAVLGALLASLALVAGCSGAGALGAEEGVETVTVAIVSNPQMEDAITLSPQFEAENPGIRLRFVSLSENEARAKITASVATGGGEFDIVMISNYETPQWAQNGWLTDLQPYIDATPGYDAADFIPTVRDSLSYQGSMYSVPFYGESSFLMYRKDLFQQAGIQMPAQPTWPQVAEFAARLRPGRGPAARDLPARQAGLGRDHGPARHRDQHLRRPLVRPAVAGAADLPGGAPGRAVLRRPGPPARRAGRRRRPGSPSARRSSARARSRCGTTRRPPPAPSRTPTESTVAGQIGYAPPPSWRRRRRAGCTPGRSPSRRPPRARTRRGSSCPG